MNRCTLLALVAAAGCINDDVRLYEVELHGTVMVSSGPTAGTVHVELHHARTGVGQLATPLGRIDNTSFNSIGAASWTTLVPIDEGEGLVLYGWLDVDDDGLLCGIGAAPEPAGVVALTGFPAHALEFSLVLDTACAGASALYPP